ncbi:MAG: carboxypeptidase-like regulatory domain-containing protein [Bacteroidales bacterium]|nr:carboxypeptidase-like regulatory domain-containing protein [Bacteroidales bacterium]
MTKNHFRYRLLVISCISLLYGNFVYGQNSIKISGYVHDENGLPIEEVNIAVKNTTLGARSSSSGFYQLVLKSQENYTLALSRVGYKRVERTIKSSDYRNPDNIRYDITLEKSVESLREAVIRPDRDPGANLTRIDPKLVFILPDPSGNFEGIVKKMTGVSSSNELSSQYSVRGGNFDENLVYVNDIEIYRPFLVRSGQQEGLSFINPDLVGSVLFSSGGFEARYGDKLSSVLDIRYRKPTEFAGSASMSLMGGTFHVEGISSDKRLSYITGVRYKTNKYLLNSLETEGNYDPRFADIQTYLTYDLTPDWELSFLGNISNNQYDFKPEYRVTSFGVVKDAKQLEIWFDGKERDLFTTYMGAATAAYKPNDKLEMKWIVSGFRTQESESFDIQGQYALNELDNSLNSSTYADSIMNIGVGTYIDHARNKLNANVFSFDYKGSYQSSLNNLQWGARIQHSSISDNIEEWMMLDSAGYSLPYTDSLVNLSNTHFARTSLEPNQVNGYISDSWEKQLKKGRIIVTGGIRSTYTDINNEFLVSPRTSIAYQPADKNDLQFRFSAGSYNQPAFFKEFRDLSGQIHPDVKAQKSMHFVFGTDYYFITWDRPFKFTTELYYKYLWDLVPYEVDNVRIRYYGSNCATGYAAGFDLKVNGEFVPGIDSWANLSIMKTQEDIEGDTVGYIARPTDQRVNVSLFFQDYLPNNKDYKAHLNLQFGSRLPFGPPGSQTLKSSLRIPPYRRVDIGFSKVLIDGNKKSAKKYLKNFNSLWISLEVFNLLDINNTISHIWISDINNRQYAVPNYLTGRRLNLKLQATF